VLLNVSGDICQTGSVYGVIELDALDEGLFPFAVTAVILKVYACPDANEPVTAIGLEVPE
jgi:hypothetical protein